MARDLSLPRLQRAWLALLSPKSNGESTAIAANPFESPRFRALVPEMERKFSGGWKASAKAEIPTCRDFKRWS